MAKKSFEVNIYKKILNTFSNMKYLKKPQRASAKGIFKYKAERELRKNGLEVTLKVVGDLVNKWMEE